MTAYVLFILEKLRDQALFDEYHTVGRKARGDHPLTPLAYYGKHEVLEGPAAEGIVLFSFPSLEAAHAWYDSPQYQAALPLRLRSADCRVIFFEGVAPSTG